MGWWRWGKERLIKQAGLVVFLVDFPMCLLKKLLLAVAVAALPSIAMAQESSDPAIEDNLLSMLNQARTEAGLPALKVDTRMNDAARVHLYEFAKSGEISDQFEGEPSLVDRLRTAKVSCGSAGEIMLKVTDLDQVPGQLRTSESVRQVLLNSKYSLAGIAQISSGAQLFIVVNLVEPWDALSPGDVESLIVEAAQRARENHKLLPFKVLPVRRLRRLACDMAKKDSLKAAPIDPGAEYGNVLSIVGHNLVFTTRDPRVLPASVLALGVDPKINIISVGVCFGRSPTYPDGTYWVGLMVWATR